MAKPKPTYKHGYRVNTEYTKEQFEKLEQMSIKSGLPKTKIVHQIVSQYLEVYDKVLDIMGDKKTMLGLIQQLENEKEGTE